MLATKNIESSAGKGKQRESLLHCVLVLSLFETPESALLAPTTSLSYCYMQNSMVFLFLVLGVYCIDSWCLWQQLLVQYQHS